MHLVHVLRQYVLASSPLTLLQLDPQNATATSVSTVTHKLHNKVLLVIGTIRKTFMIAYTVCPTKAGLSQRDNPPGPPIWRVASIVLTTTLQNQNPINYQKTYTADYLCKLTLIPNLVIKNSTHWEFLGTWANFCICQSCLRIDT